MQNMILPIMLAVPVAGAAVMATRTKQSPWPAQRAGWIAFFISLVPLALWLALLHGFDFSRAQHWQEAFALSWVPQFGLHFTIGVDSISLWMVGLTVVLTPLAILSGLGEIRERAGEFYGWMLLLYFGTIGVFISRDVLLFYLFFEFTLIPMFFIIGAWGGLERRRAATKYFLYTFAGSMLTLVAILYLSYVHFERFGTFSFALQDMYKIGQSLPFGQQVLVFLGLAAGFAVKVPLFPLHTWMPLSQTEAPTPGTVMLLVLKLGVYGLLRFTIPMVPAATVWFAPFVACLCLVGIIYGALIAWVQHDMKRLLVYSSLSHMGFCVLGLFALTMTGLTGGTLYIINYCLASGALFMVLGMVEQRYRTRTMGEVSGIARRLPVLSFFMIFFLLASVGLPGLNSFVSEFLVLVGTFVSGHGSHGGNLGWQFAAPAAVGVILSAIYLLYLAGRLVFGPLVEPATDADTAWDDHATTREALHDATWRELVIMTPLAILVLALGIYPRPVLRSLQPAIAEIRAPAMQSMARQRHLAMRSHANAVAMPVAPVALLTRPAR